MRKPNHRLRKLVRRIEKIEGENSRYANIEAESALAKICAEYPPKKENTQTHVS